MPSGGRGIDLDNDRALNEFLAGVERRAFRMAEIATGNRDDALDIVQDAMMKLAGKYATRAPEEWPPLFHRVLQSRIRDWYRRQLVKRRVFGLFRAADEDTTDARRRGTRSPPAQRTIHRRVAAGGASFAAAPATGFSVALVGGPRRQANGSGDGLFHG